MEQRNCKTKWGAGFENMTKKPRSQWSDDYKKNSLIIDHTVPIKAIRDKLFCKDRKHEHSCRDNLKQFLERFVRHGVLTAEENARLDLLGMNSKMPADWNGVAPYARYQVAKLQQQVIDCDRP